MGTSNVSALFMAIFNKTSESVTPGSTVMPWVSVRRLPASEKPFSLNSIDSNDIPAGKSLIVSVCCEAANCSVSPTAGKTGWSLASFQLFALFQ